MATLNGNSDDAEDNIEMDEDLSPELSAQLGDLILGAAHQFDVDNPNIGLNFMQVFGGDEDFGFNPGDEDLVDLMVDDSDSDFDDMEDSVQQIFTSLGDSHVIRRLSYHKNGSSYQYPRVNKDSNYCYEEVYRLLEELELLCKVWRRRVGHPFTAHIESPASGGEWLREGEDYNSSDYEFDSEDEEFLQSRNKRQEVNESLTKKKYCQSAKLFYQVFSSLLQYDSFLRFVSKTKKYIFRIIFKLFLDALPSETKFKLPEELWEKIWKFSQNAHFRYRSEVPIGGDDNFFKAGLRSVNYIEMMNIETERLNDMFGSIGNLHMLVFEILFKNPHLLQPSAMLELEVGGLSINHCLAVWRESVTSARTSVLRLQQLDSFFSNRKDKKDSGKKKNPDQELSISLEQGNIFIQDIPLQVDRTLTFLCPPASLIVSETVCPFVCLPGNYDMNGVLGLLLVIIDVERGKIVHKIRTPVRYDHHLIEVGSHRVIRKNECGWKKHYYLTPDRLSFGSRSTENGQDVVKVFSVELGGAQIDVSVTEPLVTSVLHSIERDNPKPTRNSRPLFISHSTSGLLVLHQSPYAALTRLNVYSLKTGETLLSVPFHEDVSLLHSNCPTRVLLRSHQTKCVLLFSLQSGEVVFHWKETDLNKNFGVHQESIWSAMFDNTFSSPQLCLYTNTLSGFSLNSFDPQNEMVRPTLTSSGSVPEGVSGLGPCCLMSGHLVTNTSTELLGLNSSLVKCHQVASYNLNKKSKHNMISMGVSGDLDEPFLNVIDQHLLDDRSGSSWDPERRPVFAISRTKFGILLETGNLFRVLDLSLSPSEIITKEIYGDDEEINEANVDKYEEIRRRKLEISKELSDRREALIGTIFDWRGTHGYLRGNGKARQLGKIHFHLNDVQNKQTIKKSLKKGQKVEFSIVYNDCDDSYKTQVYKSINN